MENVELMPKENIPSSPVKHSGLGVSSFIISMVGGAIFWVAVIIAGALGVVDDGSGGDEILFVLVGLVMMLIGVVSLVGIGLGIAGLIQKNRKKLFSILGVIFNGVTILSFVLLLIIGTVAG